MAVTIVGLTYTASGTELSHLVDELLDLGISVHRSNLALSFFVEHFGSC
jgi:hypothetical protein